VVAITSTAEERREQILEMIKKEKKLKVADLKDIFKVSNVTISSDLNYLEKKGLIDKSFGYAEIKGGVSSFTDGTDIVNFEEKKKIGRAAVDLVADNESIAIYTGSTGLQLARAIKDVKNLIVVTSSIQIAYELGLKPNIKIILLGGFYSPQYLAIYGDQAIKQLDNYNIDKLFLSANGVSVNDGVTIDEPFEAELNRALIRNAKKVIVLADYSKIGITRFISVAPIDRVDIVVTDDKAPKEEVKRLRGKGVEVVIA